ncbi:hypothetical protein [Streptomyces galilaeus]|uniref:hypothetical protein n=1 Tax=Streptomyces galilaeus TaxID=33899 RepID=UPI0038F5FF41
MRHAAIAILAALVARYPEITERHVTVQALEVDTARQILSADPQPAAHQQAPPSLRKTAAPGANTPREGAFRTGRSGCYLVASAFT